MSDEVFLLYVGDAWLSNDSLVCMGVFTDMTAVIDAIEHNNPFDDKISPNDCKEDFLDVNGNFDRIAYKSYKMKNIEQQLWNYGQTQGEHENFIVKQINLNCYGEL